MPVSMNPNMCVSCAIFFGELDGINNGCSCSWDQFDIADSSCEFIFNQSTPCDVGCIIPWHQATPCDVGCIIPWHQATPCDVGCAILWHQATPCDAVCLAKPYVGPPWIIPSCGIQWLVAESIIMIVQDCYLKRVSDNQDIKFLASRVSIDVDSYLWSFEAVIASREDLAYVRPTSAGPIEVEHGINQYIFRFIVEEAEDSYQFGPGAYTIRGRSLTAGISDPYDKKVTKNWTALTNANDICDDEMSAIAVGNPANGFTIDWDITNWNVDADIYSVQDATKLDIISEIATAAGGRIMTKSGFKVGDPYLKQILVYYRYPYSPKTWGVQAVDETILANKIISEGLRWQSQPKYDHIYVSGIEAGVLHHIKRDGEPWTNAKPMIVETLILTSDVSYQRGRNELDETGYDQTVYTLKTPLPLALDLVSPKLLVPGNLVQVDDLFETFRGQVIATTLEVNQSSGRKYNPGVTMTLDIERNWT